MMLMIDILLKDHHPKMVLCKKPNHRLFVCFTNVA